MVELDRVTLLLTAAACLLVGAAAAIVTVAETDLLQEPSRNTVTVTHVVDGDTVLIDGNESVRLLGVDAAEQGDPCYAAATRELKQLAAGKDVELIRDGDNRGRYNRLLRYLQVNNTVVNVALVQRGAATARLSPDVTRFRSELIAAEHTARETNTGCEWQPLQHGEHPVVTPCNASRYVGERVVVRGNISDTGRSSNDAVFLNMGGVYPDHCFTAVIFKSSLFRFPENIEHRYSGEIVRVTGRVASYDGKPEIVVAAPRQIQRGD